jgi:hypothetical protein
MNAGASLDLPWASEMDEIQAPGGAQSEAAPLLHP